MVLDGKLQSMFDGCQRGFPMLRRIRKYIRRHGVAVTRDIIAACSQPERAELEAAFKSYRREMSC